MRGATILLALLAAATLLCAQPIEIPEVVVTGQSSLLDTLSTQQKFDLADWWRVPAMHRFNYLYQPGPQFIGATDDAHDGLAAVTVGLPQQVALLLAYTDRHRPLLNFVTEATNAKPDADWEASGFRVRWTGALAPVHMAADVAWNEQDTELDSTTTSWWTLGAQAAMDDLPWLLTSGSLRLAAAGYSQETAAGTADHTDADARLLLNGGWKDWRTTFDAAFLRSSLSAQKTAWTDALPWLDRAGLWLAADKHHAYASLLVQRRLEVGGAFPWIAAVNLYNAPGMSRESRCDALADNPAQYVGGSKLQEKRPIDAHAVVEYNLFIPISLGFREARLLDTPVYAHAPGSLYRRMTADAWLTELSLAAGYEYASMRFANELVWRNANPDEGNRLPFLAQWQDDFSILVRQAPWEAGLSLQWLGSRRDDAGLAMDDVVLVGLRGSYRLKENLNLRASMDNLLNNEYRPYAEFPDEGASIHVGLDYRF